jgi:hypothetical protein
VGSAVDVTVGKAGSGEADALGAEDSPDSPHAASTSAAVTTQTDKRIMADQQ